MPSPLARSQSCKSWSASSSYQCGVDTRVKPSLRVVVDCPTWQPPPPRSSTSHLGASKRIRRKVSPLSTNRTGSRNGTRLLTKMLSRCFIGRENNSPSTPAADAFLECINSPLVHRQMNGNTCLAKTYVFSPRRFVTARSLKRSGSSASFRIQPDSASTEYTTTT